MRIAHLSDLHLRHHLPGTSSPAERESRRMNELLHRAVLRIESERPDLLVVSGDLLDFPLGEADDPKRREQGLADLRLIADVLTMVVAPRVVLGGNHDDPDLVKRALGEPQKDQTVAGHRVLVFDDDQDADYVPHRRGESRERFVAALADADSLPQIHIQHYVVWPDIVEHNYPYTYADGDAMVEAIVGSGLVRLVLSGHYHAGIEPKQIGQTWFVTVPAFCESPYPVWFYDLDEDAAPGEDGWEFWALPMEDE